MKQIKDKVYETLTTEQRIIAAVEAIAREDKAELTRLKDTCPQYTYRISDPAYFKVMLEIIGLAVAINSDMKDTLIISLLAYIADQDEGLFMGLKKLANVNSVWTKYLESKGIARETMDKVTKDLTPEYLNQILQYCPEPDMDRVDEMFDEWNSL